MRDEPFLSTAPLYGWRAWQIVWEDNTPLLRGQHAIYRTSTFVATCGLLDPQLIAKLSATPGWSPPMPHQPPGEDCRCGIYAVRTPWDLIARVDYLTGTAESVVSFGRVSLWGDVEEHEHYYRAERATMHRLWLIRDGDFAGFADTPQQHLVSALEALYQVPVGTLPREQFGPGTFTSLAGDLSQAAFEQQLREDEQP